MYGTDPRAAAGVREGDILAGKYRVERVLGAGGMGVVVAAAHLQLGTKVAIKFLLPAMLQDSGVVRRFAEEARRAAQITSEHVARVYDVGTLDSGAPYMVMEYLEGSDLSTLLRLRGQLPLDDVIDFVLQAMDAIAEAHSKGIVHRDLKPANLFCVRRADGKLRIKVLDFGISKATTPGAASGDLSMTATASAMGSPFYMSPEQMADSRSVDARTDIWALGVIVFELLAGSVPFSGDTVPEVSFKIATRPPPPLRDQRPDVPDGLQSVVLTCLEKDRERRYRHVGELALALLPYCPRRATALVEKITDIIREAGMSFSGVSAPSSDYPGPDRAPPETIAPLGTTARRVHGGRAMAWLFAGFGVLVLASVLISLHPFGRSAPAIERGPMLDPPRQATAAPTTPSAPTQGAPRDSCTSGATRCQGSTQQTCVGDRWVSGSVTAGQCGAVCTPETSPSRCLGKMVQTCGSTGQWQDRAPCGKSQVCREGACVEMATPLQPPKHCDPPYFYDGQGNRVFKTECL